MPDTPLCLTSPAKLNLFLHVIHRREDGYHNLETFFQLIDLADTLHFWPRADGKITLNCPEVTGPVTQNLIFRAASALRALSQDQTASSPEPTDHKPLGVHIEVTKRIPQGGGLGGGSSNAATTLLALNQLWSLSLQPDQLSRLGATLGADVPVFVNRHTAWAQGTGTEHLTPAEQPTFWFVLVKPLHGIATASVFQHPALKRDTPSVLHQLRQDFSQQSPPSFGPSTSLWTNTHNDCEPVACTLQPALQHILDWLRQRAPARLTGTGSTCFTIHESKAEAEQLLRAVQQATYLPVAWSELAQGVPHWPPNKTKPLDTGDEAHKNKIQRDKQHGL